MDVRLSAKKSIVSFLLTVATKRNHIDQTLGFSPWEDV